MSSEGVFAAGDVVRPLTVRRLSSARRMKLAVDPRTGTVRLTLPHRASERAGRVWVEQHRAWIEAQLEKLPRPRPIVPDSTIPVRGEELRIVWDPSQSRTVLRKDGCLTVGGPVEGVQRRILSWLRREALEQCERETRELAKIAGVTIGRVSVGDPRSRWGSCSGRGDIRYSWRLILAPPFVLTSTVAHEVAHRLHMDHSPAFHQAERRLFGRDPAPARAWLARCGASLYWIGCGG